MKKIKQTIALLLAMVMAFAMTVTAFADENEKSYSITISNTSSTHSYEAYQILAGDLSTDGKTLSNIKWGNGVNEATVSTLAEDANAYAKSLADIAKKAESADAEAAKIAACLDSSKAYKTGSYNEANNTYTLTGLPAGYYLIKDVDKENYEDNTTATLYILAVVGNVEVKAKAGQVTVEKKVIDRNDTENTVTNWQDSADYDIGDDVPFQWKGTLPENYADFKTFNYVFHDTQSAGLTYNNDAVVVAKNGDVETDITKYFTFNVTVANDGVTIIDASIADLKKVDIVNSKTEIYVRYTSKLNDNAVLGAAGNPNEVYLEFSNNPNGNGTGKTQKDIVIVFTYKVVVNKVDQDKKPLAGAEFTLYKKLPNNETKVVNVVMAESGTQFTFKGLDDGTYVLKETKTPDGYNTITDIEFAVVASHDELADQPKLISLNGNKVSGEIEFTSSVEEGALVADVMNQKGSILPSTGGAGRVALYVIGAILVLGVGVISVAKLRARQ